MKPLPDELLKTIADELETGMKCYLHRQTNEVIAFPDPTQFTDIEDWQQDIDQVEADPDAYLEIIPMSSRESFQVMKQFVDTIDSPPTRNRFLWVLEQAKPFQRFKQLIDESGELRQQWFLFRDEQTLEWLREQLAAAD